MSLSQICNLYRSVSQELKWKYDTWGLGNIEAFHKFQPFFIIILAFVLHTLWHLGLLNQPYNNDKK